jgi:hypothetical protein
MGQRMLQHMERHPEFEVVGIWDPDAGACQAALQFVPDAAIAANATAAMERAELVYLACPPAPRKAYALAALAAIETGWAVAHPWAQQREGWDGFVMIFTPTTQADLNVVLQLVRGSFTYFTGQSLPET